MRTSMMACYLVAMTGQLQGCATVESTAGPEVMTPSQVNSNPNLFEGRQLKIRGWIVAEAENRNIWDSKAAFESGTEFSRCLSLLGIQSWTNRRGINRHQLTITGIY